MDITLLLRVSSGIMQCIYCYVKSHSEIKGFMGKGDYGTILKNLSVALKKRS